MSKTKNLAQGPNKLTCFPSSHAMSGVHGENLGGSVDMAVERRLGAVTRWEGGLGMHLAPVDIGIHNGHLAVTRRTTQHSHRQSPFRKAQG